MCNLLAGASVLSWGILGLVYAAPGDRWSIVRVSLTVLHFIVGSLFVARRPLESQSSWSQAALCVPSFIAGGAAFKMSMPCGLWPAYAQIIFGIGTASACISLMNLGRSFAVLPACRGIVVSGPYRFVRHPAYACELVMLAACLLARPGPKLGLVAAAGLLFIMLRISTEERFLARDSNYVAYTHRVRYRLVPGLW